jgi:hypothetical protein
MATLTVTGLAPLSSTGSVLALAATSSNGDNFPNSGHEILLFQNSSSQGGGSAITVTFTAQTADNFGGAASLHNQAVTVASSSFGLTAVGPFRPALFNDSNGKINFTYSAAGLFVQAIAVAQQS